MGVENGVTYLNVYAKRASEGKIKSIKGAIDLYIWIDSTSKGLTLCEDKVFFRTATETGKRIRKDFFNEPSRVV